MAHSATATNLRTIRRERAAATAHNGGAILRGFGARTTPATEYRLDESAFGRLQAFRVVCVEMVQNGKDMY